MIPNQNLNRKQRRAQSKANPRSDSPVIQNKWQKFQVYAPEEKPSSHGKTYVVLDNNNYPGLLKALKEWGNECGEEPISTTTYNRKRDEHHKSIQEVMASIGKIVYREENQQSILVSRAIDSGRYQIDCYSAYVEFENKKKIIISRYDFSIILNYETFPFAYYAIKIYAQNGKVTNIEEKSKDEISEEAEVVCQILAVSSWAISYFALEPEKGKAYIYPEIVVPEIPAGWYTR